MKKILTCFLLLVIFEKGMSQIAYYDALKLANMLDASKHFPLIKKDSVSFILRQYLSKDIATPGDFKKNPFIVPYMNLAMTFSEGNGNDKGVSLLPGAIGNLDVTSIADGFARFIVERTKQELQAAFFDKFIKLIKEPQYKDVRTLFPATYGVVLTLPAMVYNYEKYIQSLRDAFGKDMETILPHIEDVLQNGNYKDFFNQHRALKSVCLTALYYAHGLQQGEHIGKLIEEYTPTDNKYIFDKKNPDTIRVNAIRFIQEVSKSFKTVVPGNEYWVPADSIQQLLNSSNADALNIYFGLLYQKVIDIRVCDTDPATTYGKVMATIADNVHKLKDLIETISGQIDNAQSQLKSFLEKQKKDRTITDYIGYFNGATRLIESFKENQFTKSIISFLPPAAQADIELYWTKYTHVIDATNSLLSIYTSVKEKNYSVAISNVRVLYDMRFTPDSADNADTGKKVQDVIDFLLDKGAFIASVAQAKTSQEVYDAINMVAMPTGSARVKRLSKFNVAVNGYCGLFVGYEQIQGVDKKFKLNGYGLTAPIGLSISRGHSIFFIGTGPKGWKESKYGWSTSLFISLIDLGAVAAFRFKDDTTAQVPTIQLKNIFSPGAFISIGIPKCPVSLNFGAQFGPNLRKIDNNSTVLASQDNDNKIYIRYSFSVVVDIPLFNLATSTR
ncbi:MAG: hypothetical protein JST75_22435 [Bacteroidetes bacterium]|nr:hypothetical protein [Bacteroidota bacterium]